MGVTIHYTLVQDKQYVKSTLDFVHKYSEEMLINQAPPLGIPFTIEHKSPERLRIDIGECESLIFDFKPYAERTEYSVNSGGFNNSLSELSALGLIERMPGGSIRINPEVLNL
jgi:hypothetical protein